MLDEGPLIRRNVSERRATSQSEEGGRTRTKVDGVRNIRKLNRAYAIRSVRRCSSVLLVMVRAESLPVWVGPRVAGEIVFKMAFAYFVDLFQDTDFGFELRQARLYAVENATTMS